MHTASRASEPQALAHIRGFLLATLAVGMVGTGTELLLLGHFDSMLQMIPLVLLALGMAATAWHAMAPGPATVRALRSAMGLFIVAGIVGVGLHFRGNVEFELELSPTMGGLELLRKTITGATPVLAPGSMVLLGLIGLAHAYRHPRAKGDI